jgi:hypothetical protein
VRALRATAALVAGIVVGAVGTIAIQSAGFQAERTGSPARPGVSPDTVPERPTSFLAWSPGGVPPGFARAIARLPEIERVTVVAEDNAWLVRSWSADGVLVDRPRPPFMIPIDAAAVDPASFARFLAPAERSVVVDLRAGQGILGATSAELRGLGPGAVLRFAGGERIEVAAVLPDELVGAAELFVSKETGRSIGVTHDRYLLLQPAPGRLPTSRRLERLIEPLMPPTVEGVYRRVRVRAPGETPYFRQGDAVLPPVLIKALFGEFAARPEPGRPGYVDVDPRWYDANIETTTVPVLGKVTCHVALIPQIEGAMTEVESLGLGDAIRTYDGCFAARYINRNPANLLSHHSWGIAFDVNAATNPVGAPPDQDPALVEVMERWGFIWGGGFIVPDGNHFEYRRPPA